MKIKYNIRKIRLKKGYTQLKLAELSGVCKSNISAYETGKIKNPSLKDVLLLALALEVDIKELYEIRKRKRDKK